MKNKTFFIPWVGLCLLLLFLWLVYYNIYCQEKEQYFSSIEDLFLVLEEFCNNHCGEIWSIDNIHHFNDTLLFVVIHTATGRLDISIQPKARAIIVEDTTIPDWKQRVFHYSGKK